MGKKQFWLYIFTPLAVVSITLSVVLPITIINAKKKRFIRLTEKTPTSIVDNKERVSIHTDAQHAYLQGDIEDINTYACGKEELSRPKPVEFTWDGSESSYTVYLSENSNYSDPIKYNIDEPKVSFTNLKIDTEYFYKVVFNDLVIKEESFLTSDEVIRNMYVSGVTNVRDLGGYKVVGGKVKQGLIYRTGRLNENGTESVVEKINAKGKATMLNEMKVKAEIDLRVVENNEVGALSEGIGVLGEGVHYYQCPMDYNKSFESDYNEPSVRKVFEILGNSNNYPVFFHCSIGTDRTGYIAWLINAVLGVEEGYLWRDYLFSNFGNIGSKRTTSNISGGYVSTINKAKGKSLKEKAENYLLAKGVKQSEIDTLRSIMIG